MLDNRDTFLNILEGIEELSRSCPIVFSAHPRTKKRITEFGLEHFFDFGDKPQSDASSATKNSNGQAKKIRLLDPLGYIDFLCLMKHASIVVTDSGGIQEETTCLGVPCVTVRENTERPVTLTCGTNTIAGTRSENIREAIKANAGKRMNARVPEKRDGRAGTRIIKVIVSELLKKRPEQVAHLR